MLILAFEVITRTHITSCTIFPFVAYFVGYYLVKLEVCLDFVVSGWCFLPSKHGAKMRPDRGSEVNRDIYLKFAR